MNQLINKVDIKESGELVIPESNKLNFIEWGKFDRKVLCVSGKTFYKKYTLDQIKRMLQNSDFDKDVIVLLHNGHIGFGMAKPTEKENQRRLNKLLQLIDGTGYKIIKQCENSFILRSV